MLTSDLFVVANLRVFIRRELTGWLSTLLSLCVTTVGQRGRPGVSPNVEAGQKGAPGPAGPRGHKGEPARDGADGECSCLFVCLYACVCDNVYWRVKTNLHLPCSRDLTCNVTQTLCWCSGSKCWSRLHYSHASLPASSMLRQLSLLSSAERNSSYPVLAKACCR